MMKVYALNVMDSGIHLTANKKYNVIAFQDDDEDLPLIIDDEGDEITLSLIDCAFISPYKWIVEND